MNNDSFDVVVIGGGISGLTAATLLKRKRFRTLLVESSPRAGGSITTWRKDDFIFELGPNTVLGNCPEIDDLLEVAGLLEKKIVASPESKKRYIVRGGRLVPLPLGPLSFITTSAFSAKAKLRLLKEPFVPPPKEGGEETVGEFTTRRLGKEFLDYAVGPFVSGVYAGDPSRLSIQHAVPKIYALEKNYGGLIKGALAKRKGGQPSGSLISFPTGLDALPETLSSLLGESFLPQHAVLGVSGEKGTYSVRTRAGDGSMKEIKTSAVIVAVPAHEASEILKDLKGFFAEGISTLPYAPVAVVCLGYSREDVGNPLKGFGFLAPEVENRFVLGCLFSSSLFPLRAPRGFVSLTAFVGGAIHPERALMEEWEILDRAVADISPLLGIAGKPCVSRVTVWDRAIPQYLIGHGAYKSSAQAFERENGGVFISGNLLHGVSVGNCIENATSVAARAASFLGEIKSGKMES